MKKSIAVFIFRRDFRLHDNPAWARCVEWCISNGCRLAPVFIFSDTQVDPSRNPYFSHRAYSYMVGALNYLRARKLNGILTFLHVRGGAPDTGALAGIADAHPLRAVFFNRDVTPFAVQRDRAIVDWCAQRGVHCEPGPPGEGYLLWPAGTVLTTSSGSVPKSFSAFYRYTESKQVADPIAEPALPPLSRVKAGKDLEPTGLKPAIPLAGGSDPEVALHNVLSGSFDSYADTRNDFQIPTTRLSVHLKFGRVSPTEVMIAARGRGMKEFARQLLWREFYYHLAHGYPALLTPPNSHIRPGRQRIAWGDEDHASSSRWIRGETGEPLVDQAMKQLGRTGYIHNRLRMVVASYFTKDMGMDWRIGERLMATMLVDYDPAQNSGGWQAMDAQLPGQEIKASTQLRKYGNVVFE